MKRSAWMLVLVLSACAGRSLDNGAASQSGTSQGDASQTVSTNHDAGSGNDAAPPLQTGEIACGTQTCGANQFCFTDCCESQFNPCYVRPSGGCMHKRDEIPACNGVPNGCVCEDDTDPSKCPAPPSCDHATVPFCITVSTETAESCQFPGEGSGNPCYASSGECDPNSRSITCTCQM